MTQRLTGSCSGRYPLEHWVWQKSKRCLLWISCSSVTTGRKRREPPGWRVCSWQGAHTRTRTNSQTETTEDTQASVRTGRHYWRFVVFFFKWLYGSRKGTLHSCDIRQAFCRQRALIISLIILRRAWRPFKAGKKNATTLRIFFFLLHPSFQIQDLTLSDATKRAACPCKISELGNFYLTTRPSTWSEGK